MLEGTTVNITDKSGSAGGRRTGMPGSLGSSNTTGPGIGGNKGETYAVDTSNILFILSGAFVGLEKIVQDRLAKGVSSQAYNGLFYCTHVKFLVYWLPRYSAIFIRRYICQRKRVQSSSPFIG